MYRSLLFGRPDPGRAPSRPRRGSQALRRFALTVALALTVAPLTGFGATSARATPADRPVTAAGLADLAALPPAMDCTDVTGLNVDKAAGAKVTWRSATVVTTGAPAPYCEVRGTIAPASTIVLRLPVEGWTQRYVQTGCGGLCGSANINFTQASSCPPVRDGTVASATTDMGHQGQPDGSWALDNPQAQIDFAYRSVHLTSVVAKAVITRFYHHKIAYSYFNGCSDGGREALMEAQRFPDDFDGIAAGAPANNMAVQNTYHHAWNVVANLDDDGDHILLAGKLPLIHTAVLAECDALDGLKDGVIDDPSRCDFDPASIVCRTGQDPGNCLSKAEADVVRRLHDGATDAEGRRLEPAVGHEWGSELGWTLFVPAAQGQQVSSEMFALSYLRYLAHPGAQDPDFQLTDLKFTVEEFWKTVQSSAYMSALDPNLTSFRKAGGKLVLWHGWNDQHIAPRSTLAYYDAMRRAMGSRTVDSFTKLYLFPGMAHCGGGEGPNTFDILTPVMAWTESGQRPSQVIASVTTGSSSRTRPVYPYPTVARYDGSGSTDEAANFVPYTPRPVSDSSYHWIGERLYSSDYQTWARAEGTSLVQRPSSTWLTRKAG